VLSLAVAQTPRLTLAAPVKRRRVVVPASDRRFQGIDDLLRCLQILPGQRPAADDALD